MSSFHTASHSTYYWSRGSDQMVEAVGNEQAAVAATFDAGADADPIPAQNLDWTFAGVIDDLLPNVGVGLGGLEATGAGACNPEFDYSRGIPETYKHMSTDFLGAWPAATPPLTEADTPASMPSGATWDGCVLPPAQPGTERYSNPLPCSSATSARLSQAELAPLFKPGQFDGLTPLYVDGNWGMTGPYFDMFHDFGTTSWGSAEVSTTLVGVTNIGTSQSMSYAARSPSSQGTILGKRPQSEGRTNDGHEINGDQRPRPRKKVKENMVAGGVLEAAGSTSGAHLKSATETPEEYSNKSEAAGREAGMLAAPNAQGVYHQSLLGPSVQGSVGTTAQGELPWIGGSEEEATAIPYYASNVVQQPVLSSNVRDGERDNFKIPKRLGERHTSLLEATSDDLTRGTVRELKCRLCPGAGFSNWEDFKRHCDLMEAHPLKILFCRHCGDFFARSDSLERHQKKRLPECFSVTPAEAEAKSTETKKVHDAFKEKLEKCLGTSGETWTPFSQIVKEMFPNSSKRGSRQQCRIKAPKA